jgi:hypothetical protein
LLTSSLSVARVEIVKLFRLNELKERISSNPGLRDWSPGPRRREAVADRGNG